MICSRCASRIARGSVSLRPTFQSISTLSAPTRRFNSTIADTAETPTSKAKKKDSKPLSSTPAGTTLKGINYLKKLSDPIALPDAEYPPWLWGVLDSRKPNLSMESSDVDVDLYSKSKIKRKAAQKRARARGTEDVVMEVPLDHQTVDMPFEDVEEASAARAEAKKVARARRKAGIKERNFLGGLR